MVEATSIETSPVWEILHVVVSWFRSEGREVGGVLRTVMDTLEKIHRLEDDRFLQLSPSAFKTLAHLSPPVIEI